MESHILLSRKYLSLYGVMQSSASCCSVDPPAKPRSEDCYVIKHCIAKYIPHSLDMDADEQPLWSPPPNHKGYNSGSFRGNQSLRFLLLVYHVAILRPESFNQPTLSGCTYISASKKKCGHRFRTGGLTQARGTFQMRVRCCYLFLCC